MTGRYNIHTAIKCHILEIKPGYFSHFDFYLGGKNLHLILKIVKQYIYLFIYLILLYFTDYVFPQSFKKQNKK